MQPIVIWVLLLVLPPRLCKAEDHCKGPICYVVDELDARNRNAFQVNCSNITKYNPAKVIRYRCSTDFSLSGLMNRIEQLCTPTSDEGGSDSRPTSPHTENVPTFTTDRRDQLESASPKALKTEKRVITSEPTLSSSTSDEGSGSEKKPSTVFTTKRSTTSSVPCLSGEFDTITRTYGDETYAFQGSMVMKLNENGDDVDDDFPRSINSTFPGLPSDLDAAFFWELTGKTYFFKDDKYYGTSGTSLESGYPRLISETWGGVPSNIDAATVWSGNGEVYFFKGNQYYKFNQETSRVADTYPRSITSGWRGLPPTVDAAFQWHNDTTYLFVGEEYYRYDDELDQIDSDYPKSTSRLWLGCEVEPTQPS